MEDAEAIAQRFHEAYERLAPSFGYQTRPASAKPWSEVPEANRRLMIAVCAEIGRAPWQPIETAPTDGRKMLIWLGDFDNPYVTHGTTRKEGLRATYPAATHWMPLPAPPETKD